MTFLFLGLKVSFFFSFYFFCGVSKFDVQKCPSLFFILCGHLENVFIYLNIYLKIITNIFMGFKIWCQVGGGGTKFQIYTRYVTFLFLVPNLSFFTHDFKKNLNLMSCLGWESKTLPWTIQSYYTDGCFRNRICGRC